MEKEKKRITYLLQSFMAIMLVFTLVACGNSEEEPVDDSDDYYEEYDESEDSGIAMSNERANEIYAIFTECAYEEYNAQGIEEWQAKSDEEKRAMYAKFKATGEQLGIKVISTEEEWIVNVENHFDYSTLFFSGLLALDTEFDYDNEAIIDYYGGAYSYAKGVMDGKFEAVSDEILAVAEDLRIGYTDNIYSYCLGRNHSITDVTYGWTVAESSFLGYGNFRSFDSSENSKFSDQASYEISGEVGKFSKFEINSNDFIPTLKAMGVVDDNNLMQTQLVEVTTYDQFNAGVIYFLTQNDEGTIVIAFVQYNEDTGEYDWDGNTYTTNERCCFDRDGALAFINEDGELDYLVSAD